MDLSASTSLKRLFLCCYELYVDDRTFIIRTVIEAESEEKALDQLKDFQSENYQIQIKGCLGEVTSELLERYASIEQIS